MSHSLADKMKKTERLVLKTYKIHGGKKLRNNLATSTLAMWHRENSMKKRKRKIRSISNNMKKILLYLKN